MTDLEDKAKALDDLLNEWFAPDKTWHKDVRAAAYALARATIRARFKHAFASASLCRLCSLEAELDRLEKGEQYND